MVTNERQRQYATTNRKKREKRDDIRLPDQVAETRIGDSSQTDAQLGNYERQESTPHNLDIDPNLSQFHYSITDSVQLSNDPTDSAQLPADETANDSYLPEPPTEVNLKYHINILHDGRRMRPKLELTTASCPGYSFLLEHVLQVTNIQHTSLESIKVLGANGLVDVANEEDWSNVIAAIREHEWMDGDVKCIALMGNKTQG